jgi:hypothetical protein
MQQGSQPSRSCRDHLGRRHGISDEGGDEKSVEKRSPPGGAGGEPGEKEFVILGLPCNVAFTRERMLAAVNMSSPPTAQLNALRSAGFG